MRDATTTADDDARPISLVEAARLVDPRPGEIARHVVLLRAELAAGRLAGQRHGADGLHWTTTRRALAEYLARQRVTRSAAGREPRAGAARRGPSEPRRQAEAAVRDAWRAYFLAVMLARSPRQASWGFRAAVVAGQLAVVAAVAVLVWQAAAALVPPQLTSEQQAVVRWLEANAPDYRIEAWLPIGPGGESTDDAAEPAVEGTAVDVRYSYRGSRGRPIETLRRFTVQGGDVVSVESR